MIKKILKSYLSVKFFGILIYPLILFIHYLIKYHKFRFGLLDMTRIGHSISFSTNYLIEKKKFWNDYRDIIFCSKKISNNFIKKKISKKIHIINFFFIYKVLSFFYKYFLNLN